MLTAGLEAALGDELIDLLVVDGPPAYAPGDDIARYPALPVLRQRLAAGATVVLDDVEAQASRRCCAGGSGSWASCSNATPSLPASRSRRSTEPHRRGGARFQRAADGGSVSCARDRNRADDRDAGPAGAAAREAPGAEVRLDRPRQREGRQLRWDRGVHRPRHGGPGGAGVRSHLVCGAVTGALPPELALGPRRRGLADRRSAPDTAGAVAGVIAALEPDVIYLHNVFDPAVVVGVAALAGRGTLIWYVHDHYLTCLSELRWRRDIGRCPQRLGQGCLDRHRRGALRAAPPGPRRRRRRRSPSARR